MQRMREAGIGKKWHIQWEWIFWLRDRVDETSKKKLGSHGNRDSSLHRNREERNTERDTNVTTVNDK